ncbi:uncharacterized protein L201_005444 [Kwoniella dendrophila CBS 6074]|uniref:Uncharacterized protein n=1 Tax=Kwoniella dendrophila CBS 6074 TaxID=1295534 RepID=A0AAX4K191_9TREE
MVLLSNNALIRTAALTSVLLHCLAKPQEQIGSINSDQEASQDIVARVKLTIPQYSEWLNATTNDPLDYKRGEADIEYTFTKETLNIPKLFVWTILEHVDNIPDTYFPTPYWNMSVSSNQASFCFA